MEELEGKTIQSVSEGELVFTDGSRAEFRISQEYSEYSMGRIIIDYYDGGSRKEIEFWHKNFTIN